MRTIRWRKVIGAVFVASLAVLAFANNLFGVTEAAKKVWTDVRAWREVRVVEPQNEITIVIVNLRDDPGGFTAGIKRVITSAGWDYRWLRGEDSVGTTLERSRDMPDPRPALDDVREQHSGDIILWGEVDSINREVVLFIAGRGSSLSTLELSLIGSEWKQQLLTRLEKHAFYVANLPPNPDAGNDPIEAMVERAGKLAYILNVASDAELRWHTSVLYWQAKLKLARLESDRKYVDEVRSALEHVMRVPTDFALRNLSWLQRQLSEAEILAGMIAGNPALINIGLGRALSIGAPEGARSVQPWWRDGQQSALALTMSTNLVLACRDKELIYRMLHAHLEIPGCTDSWGGQGCPFANVRSVWALRDMRHIWSEYGALAALDVALNDVRLPYWFRRDHVYDPFTHAGRLVALELDRRAEFDGGYVEREPTACPALARYGSEYGWIPPASKLVSYNYRASVDDWERARAELTKGVSLRQ